MQLHDEPADRQGRSYLIEPNISLITELKAIVADYTATAARTEDIPMARCWF